MNDAPRLIEPIGLLHGRVAAAAVAAGAAGAVAGGRMAYTLARLIEPGTPSRLVAASQIPPDWREQAERLEAPFPDPLGLGGGVAVMGIINVTPDSFSDGGDHFDPARAADAGLEMAAAGAAILDIGGESTRPDVSEVIAPAEEQSRILPVVRALRDCGARISVDTRNASTMAAALDAGAHIVNDVSALAHDPAAARLLAGRDCPLVLMHMRGTPQTMNALADYEDVAVDVARELAARVRAAEEAGIARARITIDPGIGFAKHTRQNTELLARLPLLLNLGLPILVGLSRKRFVRRISKSIGPKGSGPGSLAGALHALAHGARVLRVHDVPATMQALRVWQALAGVA